ncbi:hypothetical protein MIR68_010421 [Amoeboaphelidium protococcarum]|nr:hypothetical protein MIR68_010421 [Amoeboaphelidium protococcarum]
MLSKIRRSMSYQLKQDQNKLTFGYQSKLPMLPVPTLKDTAEKYLRSIYPAFRQQGPEGEKNYEQHVKLVNDFFKDPKVLQAQNQLEQRASDMAKHRKSWLIDWWNDYAYMGYRDSVVLNVSYFFQFKDDPYRRDQCVRAASIIQEAMKFRSMLNEQSLHPDTSGRKGHPLDMHQYAFMFNACRQPYAGSDQTLLYDPQENNHVLVIRKGRFYTLYPFADQKQLNEQDLAQALMSIKKDADQNGFDGFPVGALTSENRDVWTRYYQHLKSLSGRNEDVLRQIESAAFVICLDDEPSMEQYPGDSPQTLSEVGRALWHGDGKNRWFDKSLQFIVFQNGKAGFLGEHSMMDATPTHRLCEYILDNAFKNGKQEAAKTPSGGDQVQALDVKVAQRLQFHLDEQLKCGIDRAVDRFQQDIARHDHHVLAYNKYGKNRIKQLKLSPDAFVQLSIQLAYFKLFGVSRSTYESATARKFAWGRTETCRSVSNESLQFVQSAVQGKTEVSVKQLDQLGRAAIDHHGKYMADCVEGRGVDRHFLGLKMLLSEMKHKPALLDDPVFKDSSYWYISSSQITSEYYDGYGWGQVVPEGFGIAYMIKNDSIHYNIASLKEGPGSWLKHNGTSGSAERNAGVKNACAKMGHLLSESLDEMSIIFGSNPIVQHSNASGESKSMSKL